MPRLAELGRGLGFSDVWTYVNSGNLVLSTGEPPTDVERMVSEALRGEYGTSVDVTVRGAAELRAVLDGNPFPDGSPSRVTVTFLTGPAPASASARTSSSSTTSDAGRRSRSTPGSPRGRR